MSKVVPVLCLWSLLWISSFSLGRWHEASFATPQAHRTRIDVMLDLLGESRTLFARYLWFVAENYHEMFERQGAIEFKQKDVIPLYRMIAHLDPKMDEAFDILATDMFFGYAEVEKALSVVEEGLAYNPKSYQLTYRKAFILDREKRHAESIAPALQALAIARHDFDAMDCCRILIRSYEHDKKWAEALRYLDLWISLNPSDITPSNAKKDLLKAQELDGKP